MTVGDAELELERVDLRGAELDNLNLPKVCFAYHLRRWTAAGGILRLERRRAR
jgi:hypothetical protein